MRIQSHLSPVFAKLLGTCAAAAAAILFTATAGGQTPITRLPTSPVAPRIQIDDSELAKLKPIQQRYDDRIRAAFRGNEKLEAAMLAELRAISAQKSLAQRKAMIQAYQSKYRSQYAAILQKGGVDLSAMAREMQAAVPTRNFSVSDGFAILALPAEGVAQLAGKLTLPSNSPTAQPPSTQERKLRDSDFQKDRDGNCIDAGAQGGSTANGKTRADTFAAIVGVCRANASRTFAFTVRPGETVKFDVRYDASAGAFALGVLGHAESKGKTLLSLRKRNGRTVEARLGASVFALAPLAAASGKDDEVSDARESFTVTEAGEYELEFSATVSAFAGGVIAGTSADAEISELSVTMTTSSN